MNTMIREYKSCPLCNRFRMIGDGQHVCYSTFDPQECMARRRGEYCEQSDCQYCCSHDERDHGICIDCGHEEDPGAAIDRAMDYLEDR